MSYQAQFGIPSSFPTVRVGSTANSIPTGSYGNGNSACSLGSGPLLKPRQGSHSTRSPINCRQRSGTRLTGVTSIFAIDTASTKLSIPITAVEPTLAFEDDGLVPGLCRLYMEGRCRQSERCFQVHANPSVVEQLRHEAFSTPSCCPAHGAKCNMEGFPLGLVIIIDPPREKESTAVVEANMERESGSAAGSLSNGESNMAANGGEGSLGHKGNSTEQNAVIALHNICPTRFLWSRYEENGGMRLHVPKSKICREHRKGLCRFGNECSFLHLCREIPLVGEDELLSYCRTQSRHGQLQGSMPDFASHPPSFNTASGSLPHLAHSQSNSHANPPHFQGSIVSQSGSYADGSLSNSQAHSRPHFPRCTAASESHGDNQPLLRPLRGLQNAHSGMATRGSFSHNPYAAASSFQS
ncbi:hypothetical protein LSCM1_02864 [Leishmania martiniquensis]|uniref:C3H1-type domain-containing protein n=1 Tax=Leishmania martiniquensis TaxID=1580590 RepID=A0A836GBQ3_9TRYP|nr:hypothetical protein LSCM1_02864 [Leishmania martiniquensis]